MRTLRTSFTMRREGALPRGDWFVINKAKDDATDVYIYDEIGFWGTEASEFVKQLQDISTSKINLHLNSPGGEVFDGMAIFNSLKQHDAEVTVYVDGLAASAASFIAQAGDQVIMARNAQMMIHDGIAMAYGNEQDFLDTAALLSKISNNIADIYAYAARHRGFDSKLEDFRALMREEVWYTGGEAVDAGLADVVLDQDDEEAEKAKNKWDLSFYNYAGRERAESPTRIAARLLVSNQAKENDMGDRPENHEVEADTETPAVSDEVEPTSAEGTEGTEATEGTEIAEGALTTNSIAAQTLTVGTVLAPPAAPQGVMINGKLETDWSVINAHLAAQEAALNEQRTVNRRKFIEGLAASGKITAPMVDSLVEFVNGNDQRPCLDDAQYEAFVASYESAPVVALFDKFDSDGQRQSSAASSVEAAAHLEDRKMILEGTIANLRRSGMPEEEIKNTNSYTELQMLLGHNES